MVNGRLIAMATSINALAICHIIIVATSLDEQKSKIN
jgi:hypothetical protein